MRIEVFGRLPEDAADIRKEVFMDEQGFRDEFDDTDGISEHYVMYSDEGEPIAVCRTYDAPEEGCSIIGRVAVRKEYRNRGLGKRMILFAEQHLRNCGKSNIRLHAQSSASGFYSSMGYAPFGVEDLEDEGVPHIWMQKDIGKDSSINK